MMKIIVFPALHIFPHDCFSLMFILPAHKDEDSVQCACCPPRIMMHKGERAKKGLQSFDINFSPTLVNLIIIYRAPLQGRAGDLMMSAAVVELFRTWRHTWAFVPVFLRRTHVFVCVAVSRRARERETVCVSDIVDGPLCQVEWVHFGIWESSGR